MRRIRELIRAVSERYPQDRFFADFEETCKLSCLKRLYYRTYGDALLSLDESSWEMLKQKALDHFMDHRPGQRKQGFFNQLNEAFAYRYLANRTCYPVKILPEDGSTVPDIQFGEPGRPSYCEVKTIGISDDELARQNSNRAYDGSVYEVLSTGFFNKFQSVIDAANRQISAKSSEGLIFIIMKNDDIALDHYQQYRKQIIAYCRQNCIQNLYVKVGLRGRRRIRIT